MFLRYGVRLLDVRTVGIRASRFNVARDCWVYRLHPSIQVSPMNTIRILISHPNHTLVVCRAVGESYLSKHLEEQRQTLTALVERIRISPRDEGSEASKALLGGRVRGEAVVCNDDEAAAMVVKHFEKLRGQWKVRKSHLNSCMISAFMLKHSFPTVGSAAGDCV